MLMDEQAFNFQHHIPDKQPETLSPQQEKTTPGHPPLTVSAAEMTTLLHLSPDALLLVSTTGIICQVNETASQLFGYSYDELIGQSLEILLPERFRATHVAHRDSYIAQPRLRPMGQGLELFGRRKDGSEFPIDISLRPILLEHALHTIAAIRDVTTQRLTERTLAKQAERLNMQTALLNAAHDAILVRDPVSRIKLWNHGAEKLYGWTTQEALGRISHTLLKTRFPASRVAIDMRLEQEGHWEGELAHTRRDGTTVIVRSQQILLRDQQNQPYATLEINHEVTSPDQYEHKPYTMQAVTEQLSFLQHIIDALPTSIYVVHGDNARLLLTNKAAASIWGAVWPVGQTMREFLDTHGILIVNAQGRPFPEQAWATTRALLQKEIVIQHQEIIRQSTGVSIPILVNAVPLDSPYWQSLQQMEPSLLQTTVQLSEPLALVIHQDVRMLKEAEYLKDEFIGVAAHELRSPLAVLKGAVGTLLLQTQRGHGPQLADWQQEMLQEIEQATDHLNTLTTDLLDVTRLQAGQFFLHRTSTNLSALVQRIVERLQQTTSLHQIEINTSLHNVIANIDPQRIEQVLTNLLTNAIKYSPKGGAVLVSLAIHTNATVEISIQDHGIGIPQHQQSQIFGRFMRADNAHAAGINGTGLGLYLCRAIVEQHQGQLWFASQENVGTTFFLTLPLLQA